MVIAAQPVEAWEPSVHIVAEQVGVDADVIRTTVWPFIHAWNNDPARLAESVATNGERRTKEAGRPVKKNSREATCRHDVTYPPVTTVPRTTATSKTLART